MFFSLIIDYWRWHYHDALIAYLRILKNWWWFLSTWFSLPYLHHTIFIPYRSYRVTTATAPTWWQPVTVVFRHCLTIIIHSGLFIGGFTLLALLTVGGIIIYALWLLLPFITSSFVLIGLLLIILAL